MKRTTLIALLLVLSSTASAELRRFNASDVPAAKLRKPGKVLITNDAHSITAWHFFGNIREALVSLRSAQLTFHPFGRTLFDANATATTVPVELQEAIHTAARTHGVDPRLLAAVARRESAFNATAVSPRGACGLMQLMPATARYLGVEDVFDARDNVNGGAKYLRTLLDAFGGDLDLTLAAYNAGPGAVKKFGGVPPYRETQAYVASVRANYEASLRNP